MVISAVTAAAATAAATAAAATAAAAAAAGAQLVLISLERLTIYCTTTIYVPLCR